MSSVVGTRPDKNNMGRGYLRDPIAKYAASFMECATDMLNESSVDMFTDLGRALQYSSSNQAMENFFVENSIDEDAIRATEGEWANEVIEDQYEAMKEQFLNDREGALKSLTEYANLGSFNPVIGMAFPLHKFILMNNIFDKGAIPKVVAREPKFTLTMETRYLVTPDGEEIDMFKEQYRMTEAMDATVPHREVEVTLPEAETVDVLAEINAKDGDRLSIDTYISAVKTTVYLEVGDVNPETGEAATEAGEVEVWLPTQLRFVPAYGEYNRTMTEGVEIKSKDAATGEVVIKKSVISGYTKPTNVNGVRKDMFSLVDHMGNISAVKIMAKVDTSTAMVETCSVKWDTTTSIVEIPEATPINVPISPEEIKDVAALYNVNQLSKIMSMIKLVLGNYKDDKIKAHLDDSFRRIPDSQKVSSTFDFAPERAGYAFSHVQWRKETFMDYLDHVTTIMLQVLNDPNMTITVLGSPELVRMITPTEYTYQAPSNIGPVELDFSRTIVTSDKRVYQFMGSDKLRGTTNFILILCPRNSERIIYRIYDYQMYISNEIRNVKNYALPAVHAFERWKFVEYQPVQGRIQILHPTGLTNIAANDAPIQASAMNDFNLIAPTP